MSKSLKRVSAALDAAGISAEIVEMTVSTRTAKQAADAIGVDVDQIAKSVIFRGSMTNNPLLFVTAGSDRVDVKIASKLAGEPLDKADADFIRQTTGFAIGGCAPIGATTPLKTWIDHRLFDFGSIWAAAGTPHHMFEIVPAALSKAVAAPVARFTEEMQN